MKRISSAIACLLSFCLLFSICLSPFSISAKEALEPYQPPDVISAEEQTSQKYTGRYREEELNLYSLVFQSEEGTHVMRVFPYPVKYIDADGEERDISLSIGRRVDGSYGSGDHPFNLSFSAMLSEGVFLQSQDILISFRPENASGEGILSSDAREISYEADSNTAYLYSLTCLGIKEEVMSSIFRTFEEKLQV